MLSEEKKKLYFEYTLANDVRSYNRRYSQIVSERSYGKTYWGLKQSIKDFLAKEEEFIYLRRTVVEIENEKVSLIFEDVAKDDEFKETICLKVVGKKCMISKDVELEEKERHYEVFGYIIALSQAPSYKSIGFPRVTKILYEEYLIEEYGGRRYLPSEPKKLEDFYTTVARERTNVRVYLFANSISMNNPYFSYWGLYPYSNSKEFYASKNVLLCFPTLSAKDHQKYMMELYGEDSEYAEYAFKNGFLLDNTKFIEKKSKQAKYDFTIICGNKTYGCWFDYTYCTLYISNKIDSSCKHIYSFTTRDHRPNVMLVNNVNRFSKIKKMKECYTFGNLMFETSAIKSEMTNYLRWLK